MTIIKQPSCNDSFEQGAITVAEAVSGILAATPVIAEYQKRPLRDCLHGILFDDIKSPCEVPAHNNSAMDGYALWSADLPVTSSRPFQVIGTAFAGKPFSGSCQKNQCVRIMTGAMLPPNTDTIVIQEDVRVLDAEHVEIGVGHRKNQNLRFAGEDIQQGATVLKKGSAINAAELGVLASLGINEMPIYRKPRVSFFSTGDELKSLGETLQTGEIYDSNRYSLYGLLSSCNVDIIDMGVVRDEPETIRQTLLAAARCSDVILTSGGVSVGEADYIKAILQDIGSMDFWKILMKPGRPLTSGRIDDALFFGLPGNPVAVMVTFYQFVLPCLKKLRGLPHKEVLTLKARTQTAIRKNPGRREFQRAIASTDADGNLQVALTGKQGSGILTSMSQANCLMVLGEECGPVEAGSQVDIQFFTHYFD